MEKEENVYEGISQTEDFAEASENGASTVLGKFKDVGALVRAYESLQAEFTRRSQRLRQLEKESENFGREGSSGAEKLRKAARTKREERKEFDAFIADTVSPSVEEKKPDEGSKTYEGPEETGAEAPVVFGEREEENKVANQIQAAENLTVEAERKQAAKAQVKDMGEVAMPSAYGGEAQGFGEDLFERAVKDEAVRLRIIGEYLASLGKTGAPLTAAGGGTFAAPPMKAKTVNEAGNMALQYFRKPIV